MRIPCGKTYSLVPMSRSNIKVTFFTACFLNYKYKICNKWILLFPTVSILFENFLPFSSNLKFLSANSFTLEESKLCCLARINTISTITAVILQQLCAFQEFLVRAVCIIFLSSHWLLSNISLVNPFPNKERFAVKVFWKHRGKRRNCS